jgi:hypothetical protein
MLGGPDTPDPTFGAPETEAAATGVSVVATVCGRVDRAPVRLVRGDGFDRAGADGVSTLTDGSSVDLMAPVVSTGSGCVADTVCATADG